MNVKKYLKYLTVMVGICCVCFTFIFFFKLYPLKYVNEIKNSCKKTSLSVHLVASVINTESSFNESVVSTKGAVGLMQILPTTAKWVCVQNGYEYDEKKLYTAEFNILVGCTYLNYLVNKFENVETAIVAYNAGEGVVANWLLNEHYSTDQKTLHNIPYKETNNYLQKVLRGIRIYSLRLK